MRVACSRIRLSPTAEGGAAAEPPIELDAGGIHMRVAIIAALAGAIGFAGPAFALDKVTFGTNWVADPEAGGYYQALVDGTYAKYGLDVTILQGGPTSNGGMLLIAGKIEFFMGGDMIGDFLAVQNNIPTIAVAAHFQKNPQIFMSHPGVGLDKWTGPSQRESGFRQRRRGQHILGLDAARLRLQGREHQALQFQFGPVHRRAAFDPAGVSDLGAARGREAGRFQAQRLPARRLRLRHLFDPGRDPPRDRGEAS